VPVVVDELRIGCVFEQESDNAERATLDRGDERSLAAHLVIAVGSSVEKQANSGFVPVATGPGQRGIALPMVLTLVKIGAVGQQRGGDDPAVAPGGCCTERVPSPSPALSTFGSAPAARSVSAISGPCRSDAAYRAVVPLRSTAFADAPFAGRARTLSSLALIFHEPAAADG
jgi:hypothetical protein